MKPEKVEKSEKVEKPEKKIEKPEKKPKNDQDKKKLEKVLCIDCICWEDVGGGCHFWPPSQQNSPMLRDYFPKTTKDDWCFQGSPRDKDEKDEEGKEEILQEDHGTRRK
jgi:hypothetical protein